MNISMELTGMMVIADCSLYLYELFYLLFGVGALCGAVTSVLLLGAFSKELVTYDPRGLKYQAWILKVLR